MSDSRVEARVEEEGHDLGFQLPPPARVSKGVLLGGAALGALVLAVAFVFAYLPRAAQKKALEEHAAAARDAVPKVAVVRAKPVGDVNSLRLPGSVQPLEEAVIYARANGYVRRWLVDIGARVKEGALLAEIDTPELDQELMQARAALAQAQANQLQAQANRGLAKTRLDRTGKLVEAGVAAQQELDQTQAQSSVGDADVKVAEAAVAAQQANIRRLLDVQSFRKVTAPFDGIITARNIERGSLVTAGNATPLFRLASTDIVRVFVQVPQSIAPSVVVDTPAKVSVREYPGKVFSARVARTAGVLDAVSRTLNTEIRVPNGDGQLLAGMYAQVELTTSVPHRVLELPSTALMSDAQGLRVAVVTADNKVHLQPVTIERDLGPTVQLSSGIEPDQRVIQIGSVDLVEGERVEVIDKSAPAQH
ncbi:MAG TPA: efflux RND transporter periplasmic adaptor subunit [Polyangiaceae bacterium]|nr:efflux RND transporter periplasmic adaptor subunit [Polyangiaceae bacterium]